MSVQPDTATPSTLTSAMPAALGDYALLMKLASGGMATVYVGRKRGVAGFERLVAIKCCHPHLRDDEEFSSMFLDEARLAASIRHPNVVGTLDVSDGELLYLVMEYVEGFSLGNLVRKAAKANTHIPQGVAVQIMIDTLTGLHAAHELRDPEGQFLNLVHRDVSPQNILVGVHGVARITDFGIAFAAARATVTQEGRIKGKFSYLSPEQARGLRITRRMDIFSAGTVLWEALTGRTLFRRPDDAATIVAVLNEPILAPSSIVPGLSTALDAVVLKALERNPDARYQTAADFAEALEALNLEGATSRAVAAHVASEFGAEIKERRDRIKNAPEGLSLHPGSGPRSKNSSLPGAISGTPPSSPLTSARPLGAPPTDPSDVAATMVSRSAEDEIEHRRMRGILAAAMLLLVGSALGLILARSGPEPAPTPASPSVAPAK
jgi:eukaryotic-like serine/threonine-protein kinase